MPIRTSMNVPLRKAREAALELRAKIQRGVEQADRGELLDGDAVFEEIRRLSRRRSGGK
jgi:predicted transcriptional regulator